VIDAIAYLIANPVEALAVRYAKDWPGAKTLPGHVGTRVIKVKRPAHYFDPDNPNRCGASAGARGSGATAIDRYAAPHRASAGSTKAGRRVC
jgi:hypothetical protein